MICYQWLYSVKRIISAEDANMGDPEAMRWDKETDKEYIESFTKTPMKMMMMVMMMMVMI